MDIQQKGNTLTSLVNKPPKRLRNKDDLPTAKTCTASGKLVIALQALEEICKFHNDCPAVYPKRVAAQALRYLKKQDD